MKSRRLCMQKFSGRYFCALLIEQRHPGAHVFTMIMKGSSTHEIAINHTRLIDVNASAYFHVETAFSDGRHAATINTARASRNFATVTDACDRFFVFEKPTGDTDQIRIVANVFGGASSAKKDPHVVRWV